MKKQKFSVALVVLGTILVGGFLNTGWAQSTTKTPAPSSEKASSANAESGVTQSPDSHYQFLFFTKQQDAATAQAKQAIEAFAEGKRDQLTVSEIDITDPANASIVKKYDVGRAPMPLVLAVAPNGAVTKAIMQPVDEKKLSQAMVSRGAAEILKGMQGGKIVLVCVASPKMDSAEKAMEGVNDFAADEKYRAATHVVRIDPTDSRELALLQQLKIDPKTPTPVTVMLASSGSMLGKVEGATTKAEFEKALAASESSCCPGGKCGPGGCCPKK